MFTSRLSFVIVSAMACLPTVVQAQGPWPTMNQPSFFSPVQEFFTPRSNSTYYSQPSYSQTYGTPINPGVPQCANGQCQPSCPNGQCTTRNRCANGQCTIPSQTYYQPMINSNGNCANGTCRPTANCPNGQCTTNRGLFNGLNFGSARPNMPSSTFGLRPLSPSQPTYQAPARGGQFNRLVPLDGGFTGNGGYTVPQAPLYRERESMVPRGQDFANDPTVRLQ